MKLIVSLILLSLIYCSCTEDVLGEELVGGEWVLQKTFADCSGSLNFFNSEVFTEDGCEDHLIFSISGDPFEIFFCSSLVFNDNGEMTITNRDTSQTTTEIFEYETLDSSRVNICTISGNCREYILEDGELTTSFRVVGSENPFFDCMRTFTYQR